MKVHYGKPVLLVGCLFGIWILSQWPLIFALVTTVISLMIFGKIESDRNQHEWQFYVQKGYYTHSAVRWLRTYGKVEVVVRSLAVGAVTAVLFSGTESKRLAIVQGIFLASLTLTFLLLILGQRKFHLVGSRWAYVRGSLFAGIIFSLMLAIFGPAVGFGDALKESLGIVWAVMKESGGFMKWILSWAEPTSFLEHWKKGAEAINTLSQFVPQIVASMLDLIPLVTTSMARVLATLLSVNLFYGLIVLPYAMLLARIFDPEFLNSPPSEIVIRKNGNGVE